MGEAFGLSTATSATTGWRSAFLIAGLFLLAWRSLTFGDHTHRRRACRATRSARYVLWEHPELRLPGRRSALSPIAFALTALWVADRLPRSTWQLVATATGAGEPLSPRHATRASTACTENLCISRGMTDPEARRSCRVGRAQRLRLAVSTTASITVTVTTGLLDSARRSSELVGRPRPRTHPHPQRRREADDRRRRSSPASSRSGGRDWSCAATVTAAAASAPARPATARDRRRPSSPCIIGVALLVLWRGSSRYVIRLSLSRSARVSRRRRRGRAHQGPGCDDLRAPQDLRPRRHRRVCPPGSWTCASRTIRTDFADLFSTHPSITKRVQALQSYAGGLVPSEPAQQKLGPPSIENRESLPELVEKRGPWARPPLGPDFPGQKGSP
jgi:heat shock protein HtpX